MAEPLQANKVVKVLPDYACNRAGAHETHDHDAFRLHRNDNAQHPTSNAERSMQKVVP